MDAYAQYSRWRKSQPVGLSNRRLATMLGDFVYETSSAEDESRRILELLASRGKEVLPEEDLPLLASFASEDDPESRDASISERDFVSWAQVDKLSQRIIKRSLANDLLHGEDAAENRRALKRMFRTTDALRRFRNQVAHRAPSGNGSRLHLYRNDEQLITPRMIWGWTDVAASYWTNLSRIGNAVSMATGVVTPATHLSARRLEPLQWPPAGLSVHGLRVVRESGVPVRDEQWEEARLKWATTLRRWRRRDQRVPRQSRAEPASPPS